MLVVMKPQTKRLPPIRKKKRKPSKTENSLSRLIQESNLELHPMAKEVSSSLRNYIIKDDLSNSLSIESFHTKSPVDKLDLLSTTEIKQEKFKMPGYEFSEGEILKEKTNQNKFYRRNFYSSYKDKFLSGFGFKEKTQQDAKILHKSDSDFSLHKKNRFTIESQINFQEKIQRLKEIKMQAELKEKEKHNVSVVKQRSSLTRKPRFPLIQLEKKQRSLSRFLSPMNHESEIFITPITETSSAKASNNKSALKFNSSEFINYFWKNSDEKGTLLRKNIKVEKQTKEDQLVTQGNEFIKILEKELPADLESRERLQEAKSNKSFRSKSPTQKTKFEQKYISRDFNKFKSKNNPYLAKYYNNEYDLSQLELSQIPVGLRSSVYQE